MPFTAQTSASDEPVLPPVYSNHRVWAVMTVTSLAVAGSLAPAPRPARRP